MNILTAALWLASAITSTPPDCRAGANALIAHPRTGDTLATILSYTVSFTANGYDDVVTHASETEIYIVTSAAADTVALTVRDQPDGEGEASAPVVLRDHGHVRCLDRACGPYTDASGVMYNPTMWGDPPSELCQGATWTVPLRIPWGVGPVGTQTVTVLSVDTAAHLAMLRRDGTGSGPFAHDDAEITVRKNGRAYKVRVLPGAAHWTGYTIFRDGIVIADELLVERHDVLTSPSLGRIQAVERQEMLFDARPH